MRYNRERIGSGIAEYLKKQQEEHQKELKEFVDEKSKTTLIPLCYKSYSKLMRNGNSKIPYNDLKFMLDYAEYKNKHQYD